MAWWDFLDEDWVRFLGNLFSPELDTQQKPNEPAASYLDVQSGMASMAGNKKIADAPKSIYEQEIKPITDGHVKAGTAPTPTPTPTPTAKPMTADEKYRKDLADFAAQFGQGQGQAAKNPYALTHSSQVYESTRRANAVYKDDNGVTHRVGGVQTRTLAEVAMDPYRWDEKTAKKMRDYMEDAGYNTGNGNISTMATIWKGFAEVSANMFQVGKKASPLDLLKRQSQGLMASAPKTTTSTNTSYTVTSALTAEQLAHAALSQRLGRPATDDEVAEFRKALSAAEKKNPTSTTTTTTTDPKGNTSSTSKTKQGLNAQDYAVDWSWDHNKEEARAYQAAGMMMPWFFDALKAL